MRKVLRVVVWAAVLMGLGLMAFLFMAPSRHTRSGTETTLRLHRARVAAELYSERYGKVPADIEQISAELKATAPLSEDRYDARGRLVDEWGRPLKVLRQEDGGMTIYSFGRNGIDDSGKYGRENGGKFYDDLAVDVSPIKE